MGRVPARKLSVNRAAGGAALAHRRAGRAAHRRHHERKAAAGLAPADRAGADRRDRRQSHGGARGGGGAARRRARGHPPGRRRICSSERAPAVPHRLDGLSSLREVIEVMELRTGIEIEAAVSPPSARRPRRFAGSSTASKPSMPRSGAARTRSIRILRFIAASPTRPATRSFGASWSISAASSFRARPSAAGRGCRSAAYSETFQNEHRDIVQAIRGGAVSQARAAMRRHLLNSRNRYQKLAAKLGKT